MLTISKPLSAGQARRYHEEEFQNARENYYSEGDVIRGVWHGQLADRWGLIGQVREEHFERLAEGQHPVTGEQLVRHQTAREAKNARGETVTTMEHRAGWDATFSAPKSVSITALVGRDDRVREAHRESVRVALSYRTRHGLAANRRLDQRVGGRVERVMARRGAMQRPGVDQLAARESYGVWSGATSMRCMYRCVVLRSAWPASS
jgi:conjugative relaxase-like TrwC/TraI family protein